MARTSATRTGTSRRTGSNVASSTSTKPEGKTTVVSLRLQEERLQQVQAAAAMLDSTPNAVIREGIDLWLGKFARRKDLGELRDQFYARNKEMIDRMTRAADSMESA